MSIFSESYTFLQTTNTFFINDKFFTLYFIFSEILKLNARSTESDCIKMLSKEEDNWVGLVIVRIHIH